MLEPRQGIFASGGTTARLPRQIPWPAAMEFLLTAEPIPATRALELGLLNEIVPRHQLVDRARDWAARITANAPLAIAATKESALARPRRRDHGGGVPHRGAAQPAGARQQRRARRAARVRREAARRAGAGPKPRVQHDRSRSGASSSPGTRRSGCR